MSVKKDGLTDIENAIKNDYENRGYKVIRITVPGYPDFYVERGDECFYVEAKSISFTENQVKKFPDIELPIVIDMVGTVSRDGPTGKSLQIPAIRFQYKFDRDIMLSMAEKFYKDVSGDETDIKFSQLAHNEIIERVNKFDCIFLSNSFDDIIRRSYTPKQIERFLSYIRKLHIIKLLNDGYISWNGKENIDFRCWKKI